MTKKKSDKVAAWKAESLAERLQKCRAMLYLHEMLTESENANIVRRLNQRFSPPSSVVYRNTSDRSLPPFGTIPVSYRESSNEPHAPSVSSPPQK